MRRIAADAGRAGHRGHVDAAFLAFAEQLLELAPSRRQVLIGFLSTLSIFSQLALDHNTLHVRQSDTRGGCVRSSCTLSSSSSIVSDGLTPSGRSAMRQASHILEVDRSARA